MQVTRLTAIPRPFLKPPLQPKVPSVGFGHSTAEDPAWIEEFHQFDMNLYQTTFEPIPLGSVIERVSTEDKPSPVIFRITRKALTSATGGEAKPAWVFETQATIDEQPVPFIFALDDSGELLRGIYKDGTRSPAVEGKIRTPDPALNDAINTALIIANRDMNPTYIRTANGYEWPSPTRPRKLVLSIPKA